eukprot:gb/GEZN01014206.1/.p1 GENE.gb/GEZN01014206.1/~~gb/GEZN01014206.1/.p1  ORF type:complete len:246 (+),score=62.19 gb/GEZN01014206.1/:3-740(+)
MADQTSSPPFSISSSSSSSSSSGSSSSSSSLSAPFVVPSLPSLHPGHPFAPQRPSQFFLLATSNAGLAGQAFAWTVAAAVCKRLIPKALCFLAGGACVSVLSLQHRRLQRLLESELELAHSLQASRPDNFPRRDRNLHWVDKSPVEGGVSLLCCTLIYEACSPLRAAGSLAGTTLLLPMLLPIGVSLAGLLVIGRNDQFLSSHIFELWQYNRDILYDPDEDSFQPDEQDSPPKTDQVVATATAAD